MTPIVPVPVDSMLAQGDVIDACPVFNLPAESSGDTLQVTLDADFARVIVLAQTCDLANQKTSRVQVAVVHDATVLVSAGELKAPTIRDQVRRGLMHGWYFLPAVEAIGLPESVVDLREIHTIPKEVVERLVAAGKRIGRLLTPYREHLAQHFAMTYMRIALPEQYESLP